MLTELLLDGKELKTMDSFHQEFKTRLLFPDYYGHNLDALYDCLMDYAAAPLVIRWIHFEDSRRQLGERVHALVQVLRDAASEMPGLELIIENGGTSEQG
ncbi:MULTISPECIES: barstar family protein [Paenibacillus]|uniref:barstar family protein n=1 Tax=Paenibacillus TaxID=44249 RepID=UPI0022B90135|nr:barstar family protein [Paenibacillus caseinilyticus]MCZ8520926.1 barstar family protein [Paenibacillus caseinilyticus]